MKLPITGERVSTGLPDTKENRAKLQQIIDAAYIEHKMKGVNPFENHFREKITIQAAFDEFLSTYGSSKGNRTIELYKQAFMRFLRPTADTVISSESIKAAMRGALSNQTIRSVSVTTYLRSLRVFIRWCERRGYIDQEVYIEELKSEFIRSEPLPLPTEYTEDEERLIIEYFRTRDVDLSVMIELMFTIGLRWHEAASLRADDILENALRIESKDHKKFELIPLTDKLRSILAGLPGEGYLFKYHAAKKNTYRANLRKLETAMRALGIDKKNRAFHEMRKTFISRICRKNIPLDVASRLARCRVDVMMQHYRVFNTSEILAAAESL
ncbi:MAG: tyrosine-type recombinase/integrase [Candidatus Kapabacteria bacterium]|nr:tyrosine-type recombinase/integrase [Candidatus Kapabacteria bacterium]